MNDASNWSIALVFLVGCSAAMALGAVLAVIRFGRLPMPNVLDDDEIDQIVKRGAISPDRAGREWR